MATAGCSSSTQRAPSSRIRIVESASEYSLCRWRWAKRAGMAQARVPRRLPARIAGLAVRNRWCCAMEDIEAKTGCVQVRPGGPHGQGLDRACQAIAPVAQDFLR